LVSGEEVNLGENFVKLLVSNTKYTLREEDN